jgi:hypothetical protein
MASREARVGGMPVRPVAGASAGAEVMALPIPGVAVSAFLHGHELAGFTFALTQGRGRHLAFRMLP